MAPDQFQKGLAVILAALSQGLTERGIQTAVVANDHAGAEERSVVFSVSAGGKQMAETFSREEIIDSGEAIDAPSAQKVRTLVSHFIPQNSAPLQ